MKIHVCQNLCQGHNRCKVLASDLIELDDYGQAREAGDGTVPPALEPKARLAHANCPELAIKLIEDPNEEGR
jgi:ferredoxin